MMAKPLHEREPLDHNGECVYCDEPALSVPQHAPDCPWRRAVEAAHPLPADHPDALPSVTCPRCGRTSYNVNDVAEGYCGACHDWTSEPAPGWK